MTTKTMATRRGHGFNARAMILFNQCRAFRGLCLASAMLLGSCGGYDETFYPEPISDAKILNPIMIVAHRGGMAYAPENTLAGFKNGHRLETDIMELDVQVHNGEIIVLHDFTADRTTDCSTQAPSLDAVARESCDAGFNWRAGVNTFSGGVGLPYFRGKGVKIPLLEDVVDEFSSSDIQFMIELKHTNNVGQLSIEQALDTLLTFISQRSLENRVWVNSSNPYALARVEAALPTLSTVLSWGDQLPTSCEESVFDAITAGIDGVSIQAAQSREAGFGSCVQLARDAGKMVMFWVVNRPEEVERLLQFRPDALLTDFPACLAALLRDIRVENPYPDEVELSAYFPKCG